jgi:Tfp pilus assembly pilus retraction ATPase PilT
MVMAAEVLVATYAVKNILRNGEPHRLSDSFRKQDGSISMEMRLRELQADGTISRVTFEETMKNFTSQGRSR